MFYTFAQNNSGGQFDYDEKNGITEFVIIEATSVDGAIRRAEDIGIYFEGVDAGIDCDCCGDRWHPPYIDCDTDVPQLYGKSVSDSWSDGVRTFSLFNRDDSVPSACVIHYLDGRIEWVGVKL